MLNRKMKPIVVAIGAAFAVSAATGIAVAADVDPFEARVLEGVLLADSHGDGEGEGKCGEGKCGEDKDEGAGDDDSGDDDSGEESEEAPEE